MYMFHEVLQFPYLPRHLGNMQASEKFKRPNLKVNYGLRGKGTYSTIIVFIMQHSFS